MMNEVTANITNKIENIFLSTLRIFILIILATSIIASITLIGFAAKDAMVKPKQYTYDKFDSSDFIGELKDSLQAQPSGQEDQQGLPKKPQTISNSAVEDEILKQVNLFSKFYKRYDFETNPTWISDTIKPRLRKQAETLSLPYGSTDAAKVAYSKGQTKIYEEILLNPLLNDLLDKRFKEQTDVSDELKFEIIHQFFNKVMDFYPSIHANQIEKKQAFDQDQKIEVSERMAGIMKKLYIAGGIFSAFLLISLILILVKIERNLRAPQKESIEVLKENSDQK